jgi:hypothetical protein
MANSLASKQSLQSKLSFSLGLYKGGVYLAIFCLLGQSIKKMKLPNEMPTFLGYFYVKQFFQHFHRNSTFKKVCCGYFKVSKAVLVDDLAFLATFLNNGHFWLLFKK